MANKLRTALIAAATASAVSLGAAAPAIAATTDNTPKETAHTREITVDGNTFRINEDMTEKEKQEALDEKLPAHQVLKLQKAAGVGDLLKGLDLNSLVDMIPDAALSMIPGGKAAIKMALPLIQGGADKIIDLIGGGSGGGIMDTIKNLVGGGSGTDTGSTAPTTNPSTPSEGDTSNNTFPDWDPTADSGSTDTAGSTDTTDSTDTAGSTDTADSETSEPTTEPTESESTDTESTDTTETATEPTTDPDNSNPSNGTGSNNSGETNNTTDTDTNTAEDTTVSETTSAQPTTTVNDAPAAEDTTTTAAPKPENTTPNTNTKTRTLANTGAPVALAALAGMSLVGAGGFFARRKNNA